MELLVEPAHSLPSASPDHQERSGRLFCIAWFVTSYGQPVPPIDWVSGHDSIQTKYFER
jgi:hypothetical protein